MTAGCALEKTKDVLEEKTLLFIQLTSSKKRDKGWKIKIRSI